MAGLRVADLKRDTRRLETIEKLTARLDRLEGAIAGMAARLAKLEASRANGARQEGEGEYEVSSLIG